MKTSLNLLKVRLGYHITFRLFKTNNIIKTQTNQYWACHCAMKESAELQEISKIISDSNAMAEEVGQAGIQAFIIIYIWWQKK